MFLKNTLIEKKTLDLHRHSQKSYSHFIKILGPWALLTMLIMAGTFSLIKNPNEAHMKL